MGETRVQADLAAWLLEQLLADRVMAEDALQDWVDGPDGDEMAGQSDSILVGAHLVRWNPRRVLVECDTKRRIIELHPPKADERTYCARCFDPDTTDDWPEDWEREVWPCQTLRLMAAVYKERDGYRADLWAPDGR